MWPRGFVAAQAFWHFDASVDPKSEDFTANIWAINDKVAKQGGYVCPTNCSCNQLTACRVPYISGGTCNETYEERQGQVLHNYPREFNVKNLPYENTLNDAEAWCNSHSDCGGLTLTEYGHVGTFIFEARSSRSSEVSTVNETSFVKVCPCTYTEAEGRVMHLYPSGFDVHHLPYANNLASAEAWCNTRSDCAGITLTDHGHKGAFIYEARGFEGVDPSTVNETSFVKSCSAESELVMIV